MRTHEGRRPKTTNQIDRHQSAAMERGRRDWKKARKADKAREAERKFGNKSEGIKPRTNPEYHPPPGHADTDEAIKYQRWKLGHMKQKVVPVKQLDDTGLAKEAQTALALPARLAEWLDKWPQPNTQGEQADVDTAADLIASLVLDRENGAGADGKGSRNKKVPSGPNLEDRRNYGLAPHLARFQQAILQGIGALARGLPTEEVEHHAGLTMLRLRLLAKSDPDGLQKLYDLALEQRQIAQKQLYEDELRRRVLEGEEIPVFGRVAKDEDGQIGTQVKRESKLLELALERADPEGAAAVSAARKAAETSATQAAKGANIGTAIVFNIQGMPSWFDEACGLAAPKAGASAQQEAEDARVMPPEILVPPDKLDDLPDEN